MKSLRLYSPQGKDVKGKVHPRRGHEGPEGGPVAQLYSFFNLRTRWGQVVNTTPRLLYPRDDLVPNIHKAGWTQFPTSHTMLPSHSHQHIYIYIYICTQSVTPSYTHSILSSSWTPFFYVWPYTKINHGKQQGYSTNNTLMKAIKNNNIVIHHIVKHRQWLLIYME